MGFPQIGDNDDRVVSLLEQLVRNTGTDPPAGTTINSTTNRTINDTTNRTNNEYDYNEYGDGSEGSSVYFSTGKNGVTVSKEKTGQSWEKLSLDVVASTINIRCEVGLNVAFANPNENSGRAIPLGEAELPFTIGGDNPIRADTIWLQQRGEPTEDALAHVIAYK